MLLLGSDKFGAVAHRARVTEYCRRAGGGALEILEAVLIAGQITAAVIYETVGHTIAAKRLNRVLRECVRQMENALTAIPGCHSLRSACVEGMPPAALCNSENGRSADRRR